MFISDDISMDNLFHQSVSESDWFTAHILRLVQLALALQALSDPYCQSKCLYDCLFVCLSTTLMLNISETKRCRGSCPIGSVSEAAYARRLVTSLVTSCDYHVVFVTSQNSKSSHSETRTRINYLCGSFAHALKENIVLKRERILITTIGEEAFRATAIRPKFGTFSCRKLVVRKVNPLSTIHVDSLSTHCRITLC